MIDTRSKRIQIIPLGIEGKMTCIFAVIIPTLIIFTMASLWVYSAKQELDLIKQRANRVNMQLLQIANLIINLNAEREYTAIYVSARDVDSIEDIPYLLHNSYKATDESLNQLLIWPGEEHVEGYMYKSSYMFFAILQAHRNSVQHGAYFWDEVQFYTNIIDVALSWYMKEVHHTHNALLDGHLMSYSYLLGSINYIGAEQALCSVFYSVICFTHKETFYFANFSLSGEGVFRLYRHSFPGVKEENGWSFKRHRDFFPELSVCRTEIVADIRYGGIALDTSACDYSRKNETIFHDLDLLTIEENQIIVSQISAILREEISRARYNLIYKALILGISLLYFLVVHIFRFSAIKYLQTRSDRKWKKYKDKYADMDGVKLDFTSDIYLTDHLNTTDNHTSHNNTHQAPNIIGFEDYSDCNCTTNYIKVATV